MKLDPAQSAFPQPHYQDGNGDTHWGDPGMTLRDWFAGQALIGIMQDKRYAECGNEPACATECARYAYMVAAEMMEARKGTQ